MFDNEGARNNKKSNVVMLKTNKLTGITTHNYSLAHRACIKNQTNKSHSLQTNLLKTLHTPTLLRTHQLLRQVQKGYAWTKQAAPYQ